MARHGRGYPSRLPRFRPLHRVATFGVTGHILVNGNGTVGPRNWTTQAYTSIDEAVGTGGQDSDTVTAQAGVDGSITSFTLTDMPSDFGSMTSLTLDARVHAVNRVDDNVLFSVRVMSGATVLAAGDAGGSYQLVQSNLTSTYVTPQISFTYVNSTASKAQWDAAELELRQTNAVSGGNDNAYAEVASIHLDGVYGFAGPSYTVNDLYLVDRAEGGYAGTYDDYYLGKTYTSSSVTGATILVRIGAAWVAKPLKRYNGSTWVTVPDNRLKYWNGSSWTQVPPQ